jgi:quercetin 2,3-dioxygenase
VIANPVFPGMQAGNRQLFEPRRLTGLGLAALPQGDRSGRVVTVASGFAKDTDALPIRAEARVLGASLKAGESVDCALGLERHGYLVPASGAIKVNGTRIDARDGAAIKDADYRASAQ